MEEQLGLLDAIADSAVLLDKAGRIVIWNQSASTLFGYSLKDVAGKSINLIYDRNFPFPRLIQEINQSQKPWQQPTSYIKQSGEKGLCYSRLSGCKWKSAESTNQKFAALLTHSLVPIEEWLNVKREVTACQWLLAKTVIQFEAMQTKYAESELRFHLLAENATDVISRHTPDGRFLYVSPSAKLATGYSPEYLLDRDIFQLIHIEDHKKMRRTFNQKHYDVRQRPVIYRIKHREGEMRWFESNVRVVKDPSEKMIIEIQLASRDVTDRINDNRARVRGQQLAKVFRLSTMEEMASGMAHEISQPLAAVVNYTRGCIRYLESDAHNREQVRMAMEKAAAQAERAGEIIQRLKNFFGKGQLVRSSCKINNIIRETVTLTKVELNNAKTKIEFHLDRSIPFIMLDKIQIQQVIANLIYNAIEAMKEANVRDKRIRIETKLSASDKIDVTVRDAGKGFPKELIHNVFTPFFTTKAHGRGMGLAICRSIIEAHGGKFIINPNTHKDSWIRFTLPTSNSQGR